MSRLGRSAGMVLALGMAQAAQGQAAPATIAARNGNVTLGDIAIAPPSVDARMIVASLPLGTREVTWDEDFRRQLIRNAAPGRQIKLRQDGSLRVRRLGAPGRTEGSNCFAASRDIPEAAFIVRDDLTPAPCEQKDPSRALGYDRIAAAPRASGPISAGDYLGAIRAPDERPIAQGSPVVVRIAKGPVVIERQVTAMQSAQVGGGTVVKTEDGQVFVTRVEPMTEGSKK